MPCQETARGATVGGLAGAIVGFAALAWVGAVFAVFGGLTLIASRKPG